MAAIKFTQPKRIINEIGPGWITMALAQGSGELIWWPFLIGKYGLAFLWLLPIAALMQLPINYFLGRITFLTGETFFGSLFRRSKYLAIVVWVLFAISFIWFGAYASAAGTALASILWIPSIDCTEKTRSLVWAMIILFASMAVIIIKKELYKSIERFMKFICIATGILLAIAVIYPGEVRDNYYPFGVGLFRYFTQDFWSASLLPSNWDNRDWPTLVSAILFTGMGGFWNVFYSYWIKNKKWGFPKSNTTNEDYYYIETSNENIKVTRKWLQILKYDATIGIIGNMITTMAISLLAYTYLINSAELPSEWRLVVIQSKMFTGLGVYGPFVFMVVAILFLIDMWITTADTVANIHKDALNFWFPSFKNRDQHDIYMKIIYFLAVITFTTMFMTNPQQLFHINAIINALAMILVGICLLLLNKAVQSELTHTLASSNIAMAFLILALSFYAFGFILYLS